MKDSGALRVSRAQEMIAELIPVIAAAKDFSYTTEAFISGKPRLEKSSVERVWLVQEARNAANRFRISAQKYQPASDSEEQDEIGALWMREITNVRSLLSCYFHIDSGCSRDCRSGDLELGYNRKYCRLSGLRAS